MRKRSEIEITFPDHHTLHAYLVKCEHMKNHRWISYMMITPVSELFGGLTTDRTPKMQALVELALWEYKHLEADVFTSIAKAFTQALTEYKENAK
jgi:hypothetical protein